MRFFVLFPGRFDVDASRACLVAGVLDFTSFHAASDTSGFAYASTPSTTTISDVSEPIVASSDPPPFTDIMRDDEARRRAFTDKAEVEFDSYFL